MYIVLCLEVEATIDKTLINGIVNLGWASHICTLSGVTPNPFPKGKKVKTQNLKILQEAKANPVAPVSGIDAEPISRTTELGVLLPAAAPDNPFGAARWAGGVGSRF